MFLTAILFSICRVYRAESHEAARGSRYEWRKIISPGQEALSATQSARACAAAWTEGSSGEPHLVTVPPLPLPLCKAAAFYMKMEIMPILEAGVIGGCYFRIPTPPPSASDQYFS